MRYAVSASAGTLIWAAVIALYLQTTSGGVVSAAQSDESALISKSEDSNQQMEPMVNKRDWNRNLHSWGKRAWQSLQGGWGKRDPVGFYYNDKRAWQNLQGGWGKRFSPEEEFTLRQLASLIEQEEQEQQNYPEGYLGSEAEADFNDDEKRNWRSLNGGGWGKRADNWANFRGSWGKRDPAWTNLKGMWGKRSLSDRISQ